MKNTHVTPLWECAGIKNITEAVKKLIPYVDKFYTVDGFSDRAETASDLADIITNVGGRAEQSPKPALEMARQLINENLTE